MKINSTIKNFVSGLAVQGMNMIYGLVFPALIIQTYGSVMNGLISSITQIIGYLAIVEMGIYNGSLVALYGPLANKHYKKVNGIMSQIRIYYRKIAIIFTACTIVFAFVYPVIIKDDIPTKIIIELILVVAGINLVTYLFLGKYKAFLQADDKIYMVNIFRVVGISIQIFLCALCIHYVWSIVFLKVAIVIAYLIEFICLYTYCHKKYKFLDLKVEPEKDSIKQRSDIMVHQIAGLVVNNTAALILTIFGGSLTLVSVYSVYNMACIMMNNIVDTFSTSISAKMGKILALNKKDELVNLVDGFEYIYDIFIFAIYSVFLAMIMPFVRIYTEGITDANYDIVSIGVLFAVLGITRVFRSPYTVLISAAGHYRQTRIQVINECWINLSISILGTCFWGIQGVVLGSISSHLYRTVHSYVYCYKNLLRFDYKITIRRLLLNLSIGLVLFGINYNCIIKDFYPESYLKFIVIAIMEAVTIISIYLVSNVLTERKKALNLLKTVLKARR